MRWKVVEAATVNDESQVKNTKRNISSNEQLTTSKTNNNNNIYNNEDSKVVVSQINNELGRPSSAPHPLNGKDRVKKRIRRRKVVTTVIASPPWRRSIKLDDRAEEEPYIANVRNKKKQQYIINNNSNTPEKIQHSPYAIAGTSPPSKAHSRAILRSRMKTNGIKRKQQYSIVNKKMSRKAKELSTWLDKYAFDQDISKRPLLPDEFFHHKDDLHDTYKLCFEEITKQCAVLCNDHGKILNKIWSIYVESLKDSYEFQLETLTQNNNSKSLQNSSKRTIDDDENIDEEFVIAAEKEKRAEGRSNFLTRRSSMVRENSRLGNLTRDGTRPNLTRELTRRSSMVRENTSSSSGLVREKTRSNFAFNREKTGLVSPIRRSGSTLGANVNSVNNEPSYMMEGEQYYDETHIPEDIQIRLRIVAEQATSVRRLRQTTFSSYVSNVASAMKEREIEVENKSIIRKNEEEEVDVPEILQLSDAELQKKNMMELVEKRAKEANERIARTKKKNLSERAEIIEEEKRVKQAATLVQSAIRRRLARKRIEELRSKALMRETRMDFNKYIRVRVKKGEEDKHKQPEIDMENGMKILEEYMWESKQLIRDLCLDWWKERKEKAFQIRKLEHLLNKKHDLVNRTMLHSKEQGMGIVSFAKTLGLETKSSKINDAIKEIEQILNNDCNNILNPEENVIGFNKVRNLSQKIFKHAEKHMSYRREIDCQTDGDARAIIIEEKKVVQEAPKKKKKKKKKGASRRAREKMLKYLGPFAEYVVLQQTKGSPSTLRKLLDFIDDVYEEKITYDEVDDRENVKRHAMPEFVHDHLFRKYGLRPLADRHTYNLVASLKQHRDHPKVKMFARFCGVNAKHDEPLPLAALDFFLYVMAYFHTLEDKYGKHLIFEDPDNPNDRLMPTKSALYAVPVVVGVLLNNGPKMAEDLELDHLKIMFDCKLRVKEISFMKAGDQVLSVDKLNGLLMGIFEEIWDRLEDVMRELFNEGDIDGDGVMTFDEFSELVKSIYPDCSENKLHRMFKFALKSLNDPESHEITPDAFIKAAHDLGFLSGDHKTFMPPRPIKLSELTRKSSISGDIGADIGELFQRDDQTSMTEMSDAAWNKRRNAAKEKTLKKQIETQKAALEDVKEQLDDKVLDQLLDEKPEHAEVVEEIKVLKALLDETTIETEDDSKVARNALHKLHRKMSDLPILSQEQIEQLENLQHDEHDEDDHGELVAEHVRSDDEHHED